MQTPFLKFWHDLNEVLVKHKLHEMAYGEARELFAGNHKVPEWLPTKADADYLVTR